VKNPEGTRKATRNAALPISETSGEGLEDLWTLSKTEQAVEPRRRETDQAMTAPATPAPAPLENQSRLATLKEMSIGELTKVASRDVPGATRERKRADLPDPTLPRREERPPFAEGVLEGR